MYIYSCDKLIKLQLIPNTDACSLIHRQANGGSESSLLFYESAVILV